MGKRGEKEGNSADCTSSFTHDLLFAEAKAFIHDLEEKYNVSKKEILHALAEEQEGIPVTIFEKRELGVLEAIVKFLKEQKEMKLSEIAIILKRDPRTIWSTYHKAKKKHSAVFTHLKSDHYIPVSILNDRRISSLEAIVIHLKEKLSFAEIAHLLNRDPRTIWTSYQNGMKKRNEKEQ